VEVVPARLERRFMGSGYSKSRDFGRSGRSSIAVLTLSWLLLLCPHSRAGSPGFTIDPPWTTQKGLPESSVFSLLQTRDGYLWVGTGYGLARFDGIHFKTFDQNDAPALSSGTISQLFEDSRGHLWVGTWLAGIWIVDKEGKITGLDQAGKGPNARLVTIIEDPSGSIWFSTATHGLFRYRQGKLENLINECNGLAADSSGLVWVGVRDNQKQLEKLIGLGPIMQKPVPALQLAYEIPISTLDHLLASRTGGYWRLANNQVQKWRKDQVERNVGSYPWQTRINAACEDGAGNLIVGTHGSGVYWLSSEGQFVHLEGLPSSYIYSLCMDREGSLWVGTDARGLNRVRKQVFDVLEGLRGLAIISVCADKQGGLWVGVNNGGVNYYQGGMMLRKFGEKEGLQGIDLYVRSVFADRSGHVWAGTISGRLFKLEGDAFKQVEYWPAVANGVSVIHEDRQGLLWFGTEQGLICREPRKSYGMRDGLSSNAIQALADDKAGNLWIGTQAGLNLLRSERLTTFHTTNGLPGENIGSLYVDDDDVLWVGTSGGLARFDGTNWTRYPKKSGLMNNPIGYLTEDAEHFLWLGTMAGLVRVNKSDLNSFARGSTGTVASRLYGVEDGLPDSQCFAGSSQPAVAVSKGVLWFPTIQGLVSVRPEEIHPNTNRPPVRIEDVKVQGVLQNTNSLRSAPPSAVTIRPSEEGLEINYASLNLAAPERARFRHRLSLDGHDAVWNEVNIRVAQYPTLPPGEYHFEVTACNEDGIWNETPSRLSVSVLPPFWRKPWFITVLSVCLLGIVVSLVHYASTQRLQRQVGLLRQQEALEKERARIARDLHDQLGANLTQVALLGEMVETDKEVPDEVESHARQISSTARETTRALDEIVWTVNPSNDTLDGLINYVCKYAQEYLALAGLRYRLEVPSQLPAIPISPELRHNVFLAAKEAVNNVVKHSKATSAWLRLHLDPEQFILEIEDDGRGLAKGDEKKGRSGLGNMRRRMEDINGRFEAGPGEQGGTRIRLVAPLRNPLSPPGTAGPEQKT
jgi:ligand-binding sensor domain-containing protein/signal transduction histidine kinase